MKRVLPPIAALVLAAGLAQAPRPAASQPVIAPAPDWVTATSFPGASDVATRSRSGASYVLLFDYQYDLASETFYFHTAIKILSYEGVQQLSDIGLDYDPSFQSLTLHQLRLHRGGTIIDKLGRDPIETIQRETNLERFMYDGTLTASIHLSDVRIGDVLEYAFSRRGQHPAYQGHRFGEWQFFMPVPVELYTLRLLVPSTAAIAFTHSDAAFEPEITQEPGYTVYRWKREQMKESVYDNNVPAWYRPVATTKYTDFKSWRDMVEWALPLYEVLPPERARLRNLAGEIMSSPDKPSAILQAIHFVQDEVRYLGLLQGMSAYLPHPPTQVWKQRYGDCKDKAVLLCALLNEIGVEAYPMLVNTAGMRSAEDFVIAPTDFDHCVVSLRHDDKTYFVDPTLSHQGGDLENLFFPDYRFGLIVSPGSRDLTPLPEMDRGRTVATEHFTLDETDGATLSVTTEYRGSFADLTRASFAMSDRASIQKDYLSFYAAMYPDITALEDISYRDELRDTDNVVIVSESYRIKNIWIQHEGDTNSSYVEFFPLQLDNTTLWNSDPGRTMPYAVGRVDHRHEFIIDSSENGTVAPEDVVIAGDAFAYRKRVVAEGRRIRILHEYVRGESYIEAAAVADFVAKHDRIRANLDYHLIRGPLAAQTGGMSWVMLVIIVASAAGAVWGAVKTYSGYDPEPRLTAIARRAGALSIGGWLVLPAVGLVLVSFWYLAGLRDVVTALNAVPFSAYGLDFAVWLGVETAFTVVSAVAWGLLTVSFFKRRSSVTLLFTAFIAAHVVFATFDSILVDALAPDALAGPGTELTSSDILLPLIFGAVWIPYFLVSERVKRTFVERGPAYQAPPADPDAPIDTLPAEPGTGERTADALEEIASARLRDGIPAREVAAWLTAQGLSAPMAEVVVDVLARGERTTGPAPAGHAHGETEAPAPSPPIPRWVRFVLFGVIMFVVIFSLIRC